MGPQEAAALVAREADAGVAAALSSFDASGVLVPEQITARVSSVPEGEVSLESVVWQAEVTLVAGTGGGASAVSGPSIESPIGDLPVAAIRGAGPAWSERLSAAGWPTVGSLAAATSAELRQAVGGLGAHLITLAGLARLAVQPWPALPVDARSWGSVLDVASVDPATLPGDKVAAHAAWALAVELLATVDGDALATIGMAPTR